MSSRWKRTSRLAAAGRRLLGRSHRPTRSQPDPRPAPVARRIDGARRDWAPTSFSSCTVTTPSGKGSASGCARSTCPRLGTVITRKSRFPLETLRIRVDTPVQRNQNTALFVGAGRNDLEAAVVARHLDVAASLAWLRKHCPQARMTGSERVSSPSSRPKRKRARSYWRYLGMRGFVAKDWNGTRSTIS